MYIGLISLISKSDKLADLQLKEMFDKLVDVPMKNLGHCCGQYFAYSPRVSSCGTYGCTIKVGAPYFSFIDVNTNLEIMFCKKCFNSFAAEHIDIGVGTEQ